MQSPRRQGWPSTARTIAAREVQRGSAIEEQSEEKARQKALEAALRQLNRRERSEAELREALLAKGHDPDLTEDVIVELVDLGAVDDHRYAELYASDKRELSGWGPERIAGDLRGRGVPEAAIADALAEDDRGTQLERAVDLLRSRGEPPADDRRRASALAYLTRRGYSYELAYDAVRRVSAGDLAA